MSEGTYRPLFGRVLIKREVANKIGSLHIPENVAKRHSRCEGVIIATGPTVDETVKVGMRVVFGKHAGTWLDNTYSLAKSTQGQIGLKDDDNGTLFLCQDEDLLAIIDEKGA